MKSEARRLLVRSLSVLIGSSIMLAASPSRSDDLLSGLTPLTPSTLAGAVTNNNLNNNLINLSTANTSGKVSNTSISGTVTNGAVTGNSVSLNQGLTSVMVNTGNNVNFNNAFIVNIITPSAVGH